MGLSSVSNLLEDVGCQSNNATDDRSRKRAFTGAQRSPRYSPNTPTCETAYQSADDAAGECTDVPALATTVIDP